MRRRCVVIGLMLLLSVAAFISQPAWAGNGAYLGVGRTNGLLKLKLTDLNALLNKNGFQELDDQIQVVGGMASAGSYAWAFGAWGMTNRTTSHNADKHVRFDMSMGGLSAQRTFPIGPFFLTTGVLVGAGKSQLSLYESASPNLEDAFATFNETRFTQSFAGIAPSIGLRVQPVRGFVALHAEAMYLTTGGIWRLHNKPISGLPRIEGAMFRFGITLGATAPL